MIFQKGGMGMTLPEYMRKVRRDMEMSQQELAKELSVRAIPQ